MHFDPHYIRHLINSYKDNDLVSMDIIMQQLEERLYHYENGMQLYFSKITPLELYECKDNYDFEDIEKILK